MTCLKGRGELVYTPDIDEEEGGRGIEEEEEEEEKG
jgi:hypothetical protein